MPRCERAPAALELEYERGYRHDADRHHDGDSDSDDSDGTDASTRSRTIRQWAPTWCLHERDRTRHSRRPPRRRTRWASTAPTGSTRTHAPPRARAVAAAATAAGPAVTPGTTRAASAVRTRQRAYTTDLGDRDHEQQRRRDDSDRDGARRDRGEDDADRSCNGCGYRRRSTTATRADAHSTARVARHATAVYLRRPRRQRPPAAAAAAAAATLTTNGDGGDTSTAATSAVLSAPHCNVRHAQCK